MKEIFGRELNNHSFADLHMHTSESLDARRHGYSMTPQEAVLMAEETGLNALAITDHDTITSAYEGFEFAQKEKLFVRVIPGMELTTNSGHLLLLGVTSPIPRGLSLSESIKLAHRQHALAIAAHPFFKILRSIDADDIAKVVNSNDPDVYFDGFEIYNTGVEDVHERKPSFKDTNKISQEFYKRDPRKLGAEIGSSDGHGMTVGRGRTAYQGDLFNAISQKSTMAVSMDPADVRKMLDAVPRVFNRGNELDDQRLARLKSRINRT